VQPNWYVASSAGGGDDANEGTRSKPLATVEKALEKAATAYAAAANWPNKGTTDASPAPIVILDEVEVASPIVIDSTNSGHPPIVLSDDPQHPGGKLTATESIGDNNSLLNIQAKARVTLAGGLVLAGLGTESSTGVRGVNVASGSALTMTGGEISGFSIDDSGGGMVSKGTFIMEGGTISGNTATRGGGVYQSGGTLTIRGGKISGNTATRKYPNTVYGFPVIVGGGGVFCDSASFTMTDGEISGNTADVGGGVSFFGTFTMEGGEISGNTATVAVFSGLRGGGGMFAQGKFTMNGGKISGNTAGASGGGIVMHYAGGNGKFSMTGGEISGNTASIAGGAVHVPYNGDGTASIRMTGGVIKGNTAGWYGGGIMTYRATDTTTDANTIKGGTIYGYDAADPDNPDSNKVKDASGAILDTWGHAVCYNYDNPGYYRYRDTTVDPATTLVIQPTFTWEQRELSKAWNSKIVSE
jgi:hypothetical protein